MADRKRRRWFDDDFFFPFEQIREEMERIAEEMMHQDDEFFKSTWRSGGKIYGVSIRVGPDGKPIVKEFGDIKPEKKKISEEREPLVDVFREGNEIVVVAEVPGVEKEDIKVSGEADTLQIKVDTPQRKYYKELKLPAEVNYKNTKLTYKNGILEVRLPVK